MGLWWLLNFPSGREILAWWTKCAIPSLPNQTGWQPRREAPETLFRPPLCLPPSRVSWVGLSLKQGWPLEEQLSAKRLCFLPLSQPWRNLCSFLPPFNKILLQGMQERSTKSHSSQLCLLQGWCCLEGLASLTLQHTIQIYPMSGALLLFLATLCFLSTHPGTLVLPVRLRSYYCL